MRRMSFTFVQQDSEIGVCFYANTENDVVSMSCLWLALFGDRPTLILLGHSRGESHGGDNIVSCH